jgi:hypothetical protein
MARKHLLLWQERKEIRLALLGLVCTLTTHLQHENPHLKFTSELLLALAVHSLCARLPPLVPTNPIRCTVARFSEVECVTFFRFRRADLVRLLHLTEMPHSIRLGMHRHQNVFCGEEAMLLLLRRFAYPNRFADLVSFFGLQVPQLCLLFNWAVQFFYAKFGGHLRDVLMWRDSINEFVTALAAKGVPEQMRCFGFLDATLRPTCRPHTGQRAIFSGHKRVHGLKFEMLALPNGMIGWLYGPFDGRRHDSFILSNSGLLFRLRELAVLTGMSLCAYGDSAYPLCDVLLVAFKGANLSVEQELFNSTMNRSRECVEWAFGKIIQYFAFLDFKKDLKVLLSPVAKYFIVGALLTNFHTCFYGSTTSSFFECSPPSISNYINRTINNNTNSNQQQ